MEVKPSQEMKYNFIFILDNSGSMHTHHHPDQKKCYEIALDTIKYAHSIVNEMKFIGFGIRAKIWDNYIPDVIELNKNNCFIFTNLNRMTECLNNHLSQTENPCFIILLTDGRGRVDDTNINIMRNHLHRTNSRLNVVQFTDKVDTGVLEKYYSYYGNLYKIENEDQIKSVIDTILHDALSKQD